MHVLPSDDFDKTLKDINGSKENADGFWWTHAIDDLFRWPKEGNISHKFLKTLPEPKIFCTNAIYDKFHACQIVQCIFVMKSTVGCGQIE